MSRTFSEQEVNKLKQLVTEGMQVHTEVDALKEGLSETVKAVAEEMDLKPAVINKAIRTAYKADLEDKRESLSELEDILVAIGRDY